MKTTKENPLVNSDPHQAVVLSETGTFAPVLAKTGQRGSRRGKGKKGVSLDPDQQVAHIMAKYARGGVTRLLKDVNFDQILTARLTYPGAALTATIGGDYLPTPLFSASQVRTLTTEFTSYNLRYDLYRVIAIRVHFAPSIRVNTTTITPMSALWLCNFSESLAPTTKNDILASAAFETKQTVTPWSFDAVPSNNSDAWLWTGTGTSVAATADYGIAMCCAFGGLGTATAFTFGSYMVEVVCQFTRRD